MKYICQLVFVLFSVIVVSQNENKLMVDSLISVLESPEVSVDDFDEIEVMCAQINSVSKKIKYGKGIFISNLILAQVYRDFSVEKTKPYFKVMDSILRKEEGVGPNRLIEYHLSKGYFLGSSGDFYNELENYLIADSICRVQNLTDWEHYIKQHLTSYYTVNEDYDKALDLIKDIVASWEEKNKIDTFSYALSVANLGIVYNHLEEYDSAVYYLKKSFNIGLGRYIDLQYQYLTLAESYLGLGNLENTQKYLKLSDDILSSRKEYTVDLINFNMVNARYYDMNEEYDSVIYYASKVVFYSDSLHFINGQKSGSELLLEAGLKKRGEKELLSLFGKYKLTHDSITQRKSLRIEKEHTIKYDVLKKENRIIQLELNNKIEQRTKWLIFFMLLITLVIAAYILNKYRVNAVLLKQKIRIEQFEKEQAEERLKRKEIELTSKIDMLQSNLRIIDELKETSKTTNNVEELINVFDQRYISEGQWSNIIFQFKSIYGEYIQGLKAVNSNITKNDVKLAILIKLNYSNKGMAEVLNISNEGVKKAKQRLKKKVEGFELHQELY